MIQAAYRRLAQKYHPDVAGPDGSARMASINAAWELLRDPASRAAVDRERRIARHAEEGARQAQATRRRASAKRPRSDRARPAPRLRGRPRPSRRTGRAVDRAPAAATTRRGCVRQRATAPPDRRPAIRPGPSSHSGVSQAGRSARSHDATSTTSSGSTGCRSGGHIATRSTGCSGRPAVGEARRVTRRIAEGCSAAADPAGPGRSLRRTASPASRARSRSTTCPAPDRSTTRPAVEPWTIRVKRTIPNVIPWMSSRFGRSAGIESARATDTAPRSPAQNRTWSHGRGTASADRPVRARTRRAGAEQAVDDDCRAPRGSRRRPRRSARRRGRGSRA